MVGEDLEHSLDDRGIYEQHFWAKTFRNDREACCGGSSLFLCSPGLLRGSIPAAAVVVV